MTSLFDPLTIRSVTFRNRLWVSPMCQYSIAERDGVPRDWHLVHLGSLAAGGAGLVMAEATAVSPEGRISAEDTGIWNDAQGESWARITQFVRSQGAVAGLQLAHAGRKASVWPAWGSDDRHGSVPASLGGWPAVAPSAVAFTGLDVPRELSASDIQSIIDDFAAAAVRAVAAGFELVEIHAAHGYLLHQFLSPLSNHRTDTYGGDLENRSRLLIEVVRAIRAVIPDGMPLFVRLSATDYAAGGWEVEQTAAVAAQARGAGADFFDISSAGNVAGVRIPLAPGYQVPFAEFVRASAAVSVDAVGLITTAPQAAAIVESGQADAVMMAREMLRDPHFPLRAAHELGVEVDYWPPQYLRASHTL